MFKCALTETLLVYNYYPQLRLVTTKHCHGLRVITCCCVCALPRLFPLLSYHRGCMEHLYSHVRFARRYTHARTQTHQLMHAGTQTQTRARTHKCAMNTRTRARTNTHTKCARDFKITSLKANGFCGSAFPETEITNLVAVVTLVVLIGYWS